MPTAHVQILNKLRKFTKFIKFFEQTHHAISASEKHGDIFKNFGYEQLP